MKGVSLFIYLVIFGIVSFISLIIMAFCGEMSYRKRKWRELQKSGQSQMDKLLARLQNKASVSLEDLFARMNITYKDIDGWVSNNGIIIRSSIESIINTNRIELITFDNFDRCQHYLIKFQPISGRWKSTATWEEVQDNVILVMTVSTSYSEYTEEERETFHI